MLLEDELAKRFPEACRKLCLTESFKSVLAAAGYASPDDLPFGAVVGMVNVIDCKSSETLSKVISDVERAFGDYGPGRFGYITDDRERFHEPIEVSGQQGWWDYEKKLTRTQKRARSNKSPPVNNLHRGQNKIIDLSEAEFRNSVSSERDAALSERFRK